MTVTKMKLITVQYLGFTAMDRRFSGPMLPWIVSEIRKRDSYEQVSLGVEDGCIQAYNVDFELQWSHRVHQVTRFSQVEPDRCCFLYLYRDDAEQLLYCYLFQANKLTDVADLYQQMRDQANNSSGQNSYGPQRSLSSAAQLTSLCVDISPSSSHFFEVLYVGKIKISHRKVPESFIDDALDKFRAHEFEKARGRVRTMSVSSDCASDTDMERRGSVDSTASEATLSLDVPSSASSCAATPVTETQASATVTTASEHEEALKQKDTSDTAKYHNRTMVLQVGRNDLRLISPDRKLILLHKQHRDVASCVQGLRNPEHFGFICKEHTTHVATPIQQTAQQPGAWYVGYIFKCESSSVASDAVNAISQAFTNPESAKNGQARSPPHLTSCEHCPMVWYHRLCAEVENLSDRKTQAAIFRRIDQLDEDEQTTIVTKFKGAETDSIREQNEFLMMLLRAHCEMKQMRHMHDTAENRSEFLNQYLGGSTIFMKAKRSLSNSFDHLLKRKGSKDDVGVNIREMSLPVTQHQTGSKELLTPDCLDGESRQRHISGSRGLSPEHIDKNLKSPMMDIFMKVGSSPKVAEESSPKGHSTPGGSWRQAIFNRVVTPQKQAHIPKTRDKAELRALWKRAIKQAILLVRMEKENARLRARQEETAVKRIKLEYDEMLPSPAESSDLTELWDSLMTGSNYKQASEQLLLQAIRRGVPRSKRGEVWQFLAEQQCLKHSPPAAAAKHPNYSTPYSELLKQLTSHQHAILIDLGRTFPQHPYFSSPLGPGQLALFNLLKAYSLLDNEVGYCQGLSFVAGVLLLHMEESEAYRLLRHLMFGRDLRCQYLPDMVALQVQLYQLSRLLHDRLPDLYRHLDSHEVAPTLYAAPWLLTLFASQFPLGFVTRVFDLLFLEGSDVLFKIALALLTHHGEALLACESFEEIMDYLKNTLPAIDSATLDAIMRQVFHMSDVTKQLNEYKVEYQVLQEEMMSVRPQIDALHRLEVENAALQEQNKQLVGQLELALSNVQRLERNRTLQQAAMNRLEVQSRGLEVSVATLGAFIDSLVENKVDVEIPGEVRRIISQLMLSERRKTAALNQQSSQSNILSRTLSNGTQMFRKNPNQLGEKHQMVKSLSTGKITLTPPPESSVPRSNSLNSQSEIRQELGANTSLPGLRVISDDSIPEKSERTKPTSLGTKMSHFFSSSHNQILQNKLSAASPTDHGGTTIKQVIREDSRENLMSPTTDTPSGPPNFTNIQPPITEVDTSNSPTSSVDSGVGTPMSPKHPLSNCDVNFTFNGTTKLKNIRMISRNLSRNSSPDLLGK